MDRNELIIEVSSNADSWDYLAKMASKHKFSLNEFWVILQQISEERKDEFDRKWDDKYKYGYDK